MVLIGMRWQELLNKPNKENFMKRFLLLFLILLFTPSLLWGGGVTLGGGDTLGGGVSILAGGTTNCISGTYVLGWNGDWTLDTDKACIGSTDTTGKDSALVIGGTFSTDYGESGSIGFIVDGTNHFSRYDQTLRQYAKDNVAQTIWMRIYISAALDADPYVIRLVDSAATTETIRIDIATVTGSVYAVGTYRAISATSGILATGSWITVGSSWDKGGTEKLAVCYGVTWSAEFDISAQSFTTGVNQIFVGNAGGGAPGAGKYVYIDKWVIQDGYKTACPW